MLLAVAGVAGYLIVGRANGAKQASVLPTRVVSTQAVSIAVSGPASQSETLLASQSDLVFTVDGPAGAQWTSDQMAGGTYVFIYLPDGRCLAARASGTAPVVILERCDLQASQRWLRQDPSVGANGLDYWQLRNLADGRCLAAGPVGSAAQVAPCQASAGWRQQIAFPTAS